MAAGGWVRGIRRCQNKQLRKTKNSLGPKPVLEVHPDLVILPWLILNSVECKSEKNLAVCKH